MEMADSVKIPDLNDRSKFNLSHKHLLSTRMGYLVPNLLIPVYPSDSISCETNLMIRLSPLMAPIFSDVNVFQEYYFVPYRLIWNDFEDWITGGELGTDTSTWPYMAHTAAGLGQINEGELADYLGFPVDVDVTVSALPFRAYALVYNEWYRDQDLVTALTIDLTDGADVTTNIDLQKRAYAKDYFTSAAPYPQKGNNEVTLPLGTSADVDGSTITPAVTRTTNAQAWSVYDAGAQTQPGAGAVNVNNNNNLDSFGGAATNPYSLDPNAYLYTSIDPSTYSLTADLSTATSATINELREAIAEQLFWEKRARGGGRYVEYTQLEFGIRPYDQLRRPEYLGGARLPLIVSEVLTTSSGDGAGGDDIGALYGHGISAGTSTFSKSFREHGLILGILSVMPENLYMNQGVNRNWVDNMTRFDMLHPEFVAIGEQSIYTRELWGGDAKKATVFGYQGAYNHLRYMQSQVHGAFRDTAKLDYWHQARLFAAEPSLNQAFIEPDVSTATDILRIHQVTNEDTVYAICDHDIRALRPLPKFPEPAGLGLA
jgi:hypothetical protein